jgi:hypothetical protein
MWLRLRAMLARPRRWLGVCPDLRASGPVTSAEAQLGLPLGSATYAATLYMTPVLPRVRISPWTCGIRVPPSRLPSSGFSIVLAFSFCGILTAQQDKEVTLMSPTRFGRKYPVKKMPPVQRLGKKFATSHAKGTTQVQGSQCPDCDKQTLDVTVWEGDRLFYCPECHCEFRILDGQLKRVQWGDYCPRHPQTPEK